MKAISIKQPWASLFVYGILVGISLYMGGVHSHNVKA